ncbi:RagB/SusD family nutrient uptake outer membrane protein [Prolixibacteraceae bacterium Z1-6]|uniref:RagB/SusD family nutrient uptake outer membrane protein n=1 Tax=Draconibacterium aestuarii TaxID=2998507 RepID=A0A9X3F1T8_9BACT|nr:RagB/SusD family nutrient uptake outer membrane protein [Prolixibacteraceae bacterium Z1-6]
MMKSTINTFSILTLFSFVLLFGCSEDYLNREPSDYLTGEQIKKYSPVNSEIPKGIIRGVYSTTFAWGTGGTGDHDDFGQKSIDIVTDLMCGDMVLVGKTYGWFSQDYELNSMNRTDGRAYKIWRYYFQIIKGANSVIDAFDNDSIGDANQSAYGQALALRAYAYYNLVNLYQHPFSDNPTEMALPIYKSQTTAEAAALSSVEDVYNFVISDLELAVEMLDGFTRTNKNEINQSVAKGLLAYAYLSSGEYDKAALLSSEILSSGEFSLMDKDEVVQSGFNSINIPGWMWGVDITKENTASLATFWGMMDIFTYSYAGAGDGKAIDISLFNAIPENDVRKLQFLDDEDNNYYLHPTYKFYDNDRVIFADKLWENDIVYMRVAEMYLVAAEAYAHIDVNESKKVLKMLLAERESGAATRINALSNAQLMDEIYLQWRIETWGEGKSLFAAKRMNKTMGRGANHKYLANSSYEYNDKRMIFEIPESEINNNPQIDLN